MLSGQPGEHQERSRSVIAIRFINMPRDCVELVEIHLPRHNNLMMLGSKLFADLAREVQLIITLANLATDGKSVKIPVAEFKRRSADRAGIQTAAEERPDRNVGSDNVRFHSRKELALEFLGVIASRI